jgi:hypothetical protein
MTKIPKRIEVGPYIVKVVNDDDAMKIARSDWEQPDAIGLYESMGQTIFVHPEVSPEVEREVLLHEVLHAIFYATSLHNTYNSEQEEQIVSAYSVILLDTLKRNPKLVRYILDDSKTS